MRKRLEPAGSAAGSTWPAKQAAVRRMIQEPDRALARFDLGVAALLARCRGLWYMPTARAYGVDVPTMHLYLHERGIHALCSGTGGAEVTEVRSRLPRQLALVVHAQAQARVHSRVGSRPPAADPASAYAFGLGLTLAFALASASGRQNARQRPGKTP